MTEEKPLFEKLSKREKEIFFHICEGKPNRVIGKELFLSPRTIETHKGRIFKKLELRSGIDLVKFAVKNGLIVL